MFAIFFYIFVIIVNLLKSRQRAQQPLSGFIEFENVKQMAPNIQRVPKCILLRDRNVLVRIKMYLLKCRCLGLGPRKISNNSNSIQIDKCFHCFDCSVCFHSRFGKFTAEGYFDAQQSLNKQTNQFQMTFHQFSRIKKKL